MRWPVSPNAVLVSGVWPIVSESVGVIRHVRGRNTLGDADSCVG
jgi:hypothetical protein